MSWTEWLEVLSYAVTIVGLPLAITIFVHEQHWARQNEEEALYQSLSDSYTAFLALVLENADLQLLSGDGRGRDLSQDQRERRAALFEILVSLFERAYILVHDMRSAEQARFWRSWDDYMRGWCRRSDFREVLPALLEGEDEAFRRYITGLLAEEASEADPTGAG